MSYDFVWRCRPLVFSEGMFFLLGRALVKKTGCVSAHARIAKAASLAVPLLLRLRLRLRLRVRLKMISAPLGFRVLLFRGCLWCSFVLAADFCVCAPLVSSPT